MKERLEDLLDVRKHSELVGVYARRMARWRILRSGEPLRRLMSLIVPDFDLRRDEHQRVWADVITAETGIGVEELLDAYRDYLADLDKADAALAAAPVKTIVRILYDGGCKNYPPASTNLAELSRQCASLRIRYPECGAEFRVTGGGYRWIAGDETGWWRTCVCGKWLCPRHGVPRRNRPAWHHLADPELWPWVGIVPGGQRRHLVRK
jgi:hypothetical protein